MIVGWFAAAYVGMAFELPKIIHLPLALIAAALAGALWGLIPGILKATLHVHEVIVTIMMNYIALHTVNALIKAVSEGGYKTEKIHQTASLRPDFLSNLTDFSTLHYGIFVALAMVAVMWFILEKTKTGYGCDWIGVWQGVSLSICGNKHEKEHHYYGSLSPVLLQDLEERWKHLEHLVIW